MKLSRNQLIFFGLAAHLLAAFFSIGAHQSDEIFQVYEFAAFKLGLNTAAELPWEFHEQMRSGIQPLIVYLFTKGFNAVSVQNPFTIALLIRMLQSLLSFIAVIQLLKLLEKEMVSQKYRLWLWAFSLLFWCLPYFHARFSSENFSVTLFLFGLVLILNTIRKKPSHVLLLTAGILFGLAFGCRFQLSFMILGLLLWLLLVRKLPFRFLISIFFGIVLALGAGLMADQWLYGKWTLTWWNYLDLNLFKDKASVYGREPLYFYLSDGLLQLIPPFSLIIVFCIPAFWVKFKTHLFTWLTLPFILLHFFVAHKELRFLFPVLNFLPFMVLYYFQSLAYNNNKLMAFLRSKGFVTAAVAVNALLLLYFCLKPASDAAPVLKKIYDIVEGEKPLLLYDGNDPYNNMASLNYFRNTDIKTAGIKDDSLNIKNASAVYFFSGAFNGPSLLAIHNKVFIKQYENLPAWFRHLNFNGWLDRAETFAIYKMAE